MTFEAPGGRDHSSGSGILERSHVLLADVEVIGGPVVSFPHRLPHKQPHGFGVVLHRQTARPPLSVH